MSAFWDIKPASGASITVSDVRPAPGFTVQSDFAAKQSLLTMSINEVFQNASQLKCHYVIGGVPEDGSDMIQVPLGSMKQDLLVILKCHCFCCFLLSLDCRRSHHIL